MFRTTLRKSLVIAKLNLQNVNAAWIASAIVFGAIFLQNAAYVVLALCGFDMSYQSILGSANFLYLLLLLCALLIPTRNFRKQINLGAKRSDYCWGCLCTYVLLALGISLVNMLLFCAFELPVLASGLVESSRLNLMDVWGWTTHGPVIAFIQQFAFLFLAAVFFHTLASLHDWWVGWGVDVLIIAIISVFTPIEPLRNVLYGFFQAILFHPNALLQIIVCLVLGGGLYALNKLLLSRRVV